MQHIESLLNLCSSQPDTFTVEVGGVELHFRNIKDFSELVELGRAAEMFAKAMLSGSVHPNMAPYAPKSHDAARGAFMVSALAIEPTPIEQIDALRLAKEAGPLFAIIINEINAKTAIKSMKSEKKAVEDSKNELGGTDSGETA